MPKFIYMFIYTYIHELWELSYSKTPWANAAKGGAASPKKQPGPPNSPQSEQKCIVRSQMDLLSLVSEQTKALKRIQDKVYDTILLGF